MAKKRKVNKSQAVRDFMAANPAAAPKEVSETLTKQGVAVSPNYVSTVKGQMNAKKGKAETPSTSGGSRLRQDRHRRSRNQGGVSGC